MPPLEYNSGLLCSIEHPVNKTTRVTLPELISGSIIMQVNLYSGYDKLTAQYRYRATNLHTCNLHGVQ